MLGLRLQKLPPAHGLSLSIRGAVCFHSDSLTGHRYRHAVDWRARSMKVKAKASDDPENYHSLNPSTVNPRITAMEYDVFGSVFRRALQLQKSLANGAELPFREITWANIGDAHAVGQKPLTFIRQVLASITYPKLLETNDLPKDAKTKARKILGSCSGGSIGSYTNSVGMEMVRKHVAGFIERRDGIPANHEDILLCSGTTEGVRAILKLLASESGGKDRSGVMIPVPQYPLYSATLTEYGMAQVPYYLNEESCWSIDTEELERALTQASRDCTVRAIVVINPGNPTGQVLTRSNLEKLVEFAYRNNLLILADEVYQGNVYSNESKFYSTKKVMMELGPPYDQCELVSFFSTSKGYACEPGWRGAYQELVNIHPDVKEMLIKSVSTKLCPVAIGQAALDCIVDPPQDGDPSYELWQREKSAVLESLSVKAQVATEAFQSFPQVKCNTVQGAMFAFPQIILPTRAVEAAEGMGEEADTLYALELLENTGICTLPGSAFGQFPGTFHLRVTILPEREKFKEALQRFHDFHNKFLQSPTY